MESGSQNFHGLKKWCPFLGFAMLVWCANLGPSTAGEWIITPSLNISEEFTDNARGSAGGRESDLVTTTEGALAVRGTGARASLDFDYSLSRDTYMDNGDLNALQQRFSGLGEVELWEDHLFFDARSSLSTESLTRLGANAAGERVLTSNQTEVFSYSAGPTFRRRYGGWADSELAYNFNGTEFSATELDDTEGAGAPSGNVEHEFTTALRSGPRFTQLTWELNSVQSINRRGDNTTKRRTTDLTGEYQINRFVSARLGVGHENIDEPDIVNDVSGPTWSVGTRLTPGPRTEVTIDFERRFKDYVWSVDGSYLLGPAAELTFTYEEDVETEQDQISDALQGLTVNAAGILVGPDGLPASPNSSLFDIVDQTSRTRTATMILTGTVLRNTYSAQVSLQSREFESGGTGALSGIEKIASFSATYSRTITPQITFVATASLSDSLASIAPGSGDTTTAAGLTLSRRFPSDLFGDISYQFRNQNPDSSTPTLENSATLRLRKEF